jgi:molecular chaperone IbpA
MTTFDFSPLFRSVIGVDRLAAALERAARTEPVSYPPYNVEVQDENRYRISLAVAGFTDVDLTIETKENQLSIAGRRTASENGFRYLHQGIANRGFERTFQLADHVRVVEAHLEHGLLHVDLVREVPEAKKPRRIEVRTATGAALEQSGPARFDEAA